MCEVNPSSRRTRGCGSGWHGKRAGAKCRAERGGKERSVNVFIVISVYAMSAMSRRAAALGTGPRDPRRHASSTSTSRATGRSREGSVKGEGGVGSRRCVVEGGAMVVLMPSAQVVVMSDMWGMPEGKPGVRKTRSSSECEPGLTQVEQSSP